jgi:hypothetical protein
MPRTQPRGPVFSLTVEFQGEPGRVIHDLRALLKRLLRTHNFRALDLREEEPPQ